MHRTRALALLTGVAALATLALAASASAGVSGAKVITSNGEAGYYASMNGPGHFTQITAHFYLRQAAKSIGTTGGIGIQLCNDTTGNAVQVGVIWTGTAFEVGYGTGTLTKTPGTNTTGCNSGGRFAPVPLVPLLLIPPGHTVSLSLTEVCPPGTPPPSPCPLGFYEAFGKDITSGISASKGFAGLTYPDVASGGVVQDLSNRSAPAVIKLVSFRGVDLADSNGVHGDLGTKTEWTAVQAGSNHSGDNSNPLLVDPKGSLRWDSFSVWVGAQTGP